MKRTFAAVLFASLPASAADAIYVNGAVLTMDSSKPCAEAVAVDNGRFTVVGSNAEVRRLAPPGAKTVDLSGMTVTPGFNGVHLHPVGVYDESSPYYTPWLGPERVHNMDELIAALKAKSDRTPPGEMVSGSRDSDTGLGRDPNRYEKYPRGSHHD